MDRDLDEQIDELINKATKDLKTKISRVVVKHQSKLLKDQARELKGGGGGTSVRVPTARRVPERRAPERRDTEAKRHSSKYSDSDSEGYYSD